MLKGTPLEVQPTRVARVQFGDVTFRERFIVSDVTCPLLSLGSVSEVRLEHSCTTKDNIGW